MIEAAVRGALTAEASGGGGGGGHGHLEERHFRRMNKFDGAESKWREWAFQFKTQVGSVNPGAREFLEQIQKHPKDPDWDDVFSARSVRRR